MKLKPAEEQVVALMGASSGIGRETALRFAGRGAKVVVAARSREGLDSLAEEIRSAGGEATAVAAEVTDFDQVEAVANTAAAVYGRLDTWVHLAAVSIFAPFEETTPEEFRRVVEIDLLGQAHGAMAALPHIKREGRGALVHVTSVVARRAVPLQSAYCAAKHGVDGLLESLRVELRREGWPIGVTNVMPAAINTPFFDKARTKLGVKPKGFPPTYAPGVVSDAIIYAAEKAPRDIVAGGAGKGMILGQRLSPRLMDAIMIPGGFGSQQTDEPKPEDAPDALFEPVADQDRPRETSAARRSRGASRPGSTPTRQRNGASWLARRSGSWLPCGRGRRQPALRTSYIGFQDPALLEEGSASQVGTIPL